MKLRVLARALFVVTLLPMAASATEATSAPAAPAVEAAVDLEALLAPAMSPAGSQDLAAPALVGCDKTWCSERRFECKDDCLPCGFQFTCYALSCAYDCWCRC